MQNIIKTSDHRIVFSRDEYVAHLITVLDPGRYLLKVYLKSATPEVEYKTFQEAQKVSSEIYRQLTYNTSPAVNKEDDNEEKRP